MAFVDWMWLVSKCFCRFLLMGLLTLVPSSNGFRRKELVHAKTRAFGAWCLTAMQEGDG
jgi:hypothetical protein